MDEFNFDNLLEEARSLIGSTVKVEDENAPHTYKKCTFKNISKVSKSQINKDMAVYKANAVLEDERGEIIKDYSIESVLFVIKKGAPLPSKKRRYTIERV